MTPLVVTNLVKNYGAVHAVRDISFDVAPGTIFGLIGPDGGGKTSTMRIVVSLLSANGGSVEFWGHDVLREPGFVRANIGYMPQRFSLYQDLSVAENLRFFADLYHVSDDERRTRQERLFTFSGLKPFQDRRAGALSGGMKQKLALSCMLMHAPRFLVLDEPTFGVDPVSRAEFWSILRELRNDGTTLLVSTAYMDEALLCDRVALMHEGKLLAVDDPKSLTQRFDQDLYSISTSQPHRVLERLAGWSGAESCQLFGDGVHVTLAKGFGPRDLEIQSRQAVSDAGPPRLIAPSLEDLFLRLMGAP